MLTQSRFPESYVVNGDPIASLFDPDDVQPGLLRRVSRVIARKPQRQTIRVTIEKAVEMIVNGLSSARSGNDAKTWREDAYSFGRQVVDKAWNGWIQLMGQRRLMGSGLKLLSELDGKAELQSAADLWYTDLAVKQQRIIDYEQMLKDFDNDRKANVGPPIPLTTFKESIAMFERYFDMVLPGLKKYLKDVCPRIRELPQAGLLEKNLIELLADITADIKVRNRHRELHAAKPVRAA